MAEVKNDIDELKKKIFNLQAQLDNTRHDYYTLVEKTNQNLKNLFDNSNDLITIFRKTGEIRSANEAVKNNKLSYTEAEITDLKFLEVVHPDYRRGTLQNILKITAGSRFERFETVLISKTGKNIYVTGKLTSDNSSSKNFGGTGPGLAISRELVKSMQGEIGVVSTPGLGSTFWFTFMGQEVSPDEIKAIQPDKPFTKEFTGKQPRILFVDDNDINRKVASSIMIKSGCLIDEAYDGFHAIEKVKEGAYDLIFMDIQMPKMDGIKATNEVRKLEFGGDTPIITMVAYSMEEDRERFLNAGLDDYLAKPIKAEMLIDKIKKWVDFKPIEVSIDSIVDKT